MADTICRHLRAVARDQDLIGMASCPDCGESVPIHVPINNLMDAMREVLGVKSRIVDSIDWRQ